MIRTIQVGNSILFENNKLDASENQFELETNYPNALIQCTILDN